MMHPAVVAVAEAKLDIVTHHRTVMTVHPIKPIAITDHKQLWAVYYERIKHAVEVVDDHTEAGMIVYMAGAHVVLEALKS